MNEIIKSIWELFNNKYNDASRFEEWQTKFTKKVLLDVQSIIETHNKYKWHDLRKNPEDLPIENEYCLCKVGTTKFYPYRVMAYKPFDLKEDGANKWCDIEVGYVYDHFIEAWKYIDGGDVEDD